VPEHTQLPLLAPVGQSARDMQPQLPPLQVAPLLPHDVPSGDALDDSTPFVHLLTWHGTMFGGGVDDTATPHLCAVLHVALWHAGAVGQSLASTHSTHSPSESHTPSDMPGRGQLIPVGFGVCVGVPVAEHEGTLHGPSAAGLSLVSRTCESTPITQVRSWQSPIGCGAPGVSTPSSGSPLQSAVDWSQNVTVQRSVCSHCASIMQGTWQTPFESHVPW
jgi:hypothetical protein